MKIVILGLSITSSWGNGHATTFRSLIKGLRRRGHDVLFLERDMPWYASNRDMPEPEFCTVKLYSSLDELKENYHEEVAEADTVIVGSYVPEGIHVGEWVIKTASGVTAFYDIDTPVTLSRLKTKSCQYLNSILVRSYDVYLSFTGGPCLGIFEYEFGALAARQFYCSVDPILYHPERCRKKWDLGYLGTYSDDRQPALNNLLVSAAKKWPTGKFIVAGPQYPESITWPANVERIDHLPPPEHNDFYNSQRFTLNITRQDMIKMGFSPSVRLFEAAACGVPIISDYWPGIFTIFDPGDEILISSSPGDTLKFLREIPESRRREIGMAARNKVLANHTGEKRAMELENYIAEAASASKKRAAIFT
ncbi:MAG TPA: glycosyltransferase [Bacteroidales bacterium]|nr:glycosyltransferase [Bacteroidales bacterium]